MVLLPPSPSLHRCCLTPARTVSQHKAIKKGSVERCLHDLCKKRPPFAKQGKKSSGYNSHQVIHITPGIRCVICGKPWARMDQLRTHLRDAKLYLSDCGAHACLNGFHNQLSHLLQDTQERLHKAVKMKSILQTADIFMHPLILFPNNKEQKDEEKEKKGEKKNENENVIRQILPKASQESAEDTLSQGLGRNKLYRYDHSCVLFYKTTACRPTHSLVRKQNAEKVRKASKLKKYVRVKRRGSDEY